MSREPSRYPRREFLGQCAAIPLAASLVTACEFPATDATFLKLPKMSEPELASEVESLLKLVDPQVLYRYVPLPAEQNAWPLLKQAGEVYVEEPASEEFQEGLEKFLNEQPVNSAIQDRILDWLKQNEQCLKLTEQAISVGGIELPRARNGIQLSLAMDEVWLFRRLAYVKAVASRAALLRGDSDEAIDQATGILAFGKQLIRAECLLIDQLVAQAVLGLGIEATFGAAMSPHISHQQAIDTVQRLAITRATHDDLKRALRVEYCRWFLPMIARFSDDASVEQLAQHYVAAGDSPDEQDDRKLTEAERQDYDRRIRILTAILQGHKKPFDKVATVRLSSDLHARFFQELEKPWLARDRKLFEGIRKELSAWPTEVEQDIWLMLDENPKPPRKLTRKEISLTRATLAKVDNPVGKRLVEQQTSTILTTPIIERHQARVASARLRIALRLYEQKHGRLPEKLNALVEAKLLSDGPTDPFNGELFRYSAKRRVIWCVGEEGKNEGVIPETDDEFPFDQDFELTWRIGKV